MRRSLNLILSSLILAAGALPAAGALAADACLDIRFQCSGFEPNWQFTTSLDGAGNQVVTFVDPENPNWQTAPIVVDACVLQGSPNDFEVTTGGPLDLIASIVGQSCVEPNDEVTDFSVTASFNQGAETASPNPVTGTGCCVRVDY
ncbi:hypothetical protein [Afifella pfennigii]|uniref:hypothetical protein n=1 Tax=Afifella pfennigii TaxID=209897 RepID=UPI00047D6ABF|nr:hypothetical protein [Afifella pfennigii]